MRQKILELVDVMDVVFWQELMLFMAGVSDNGLFEKLQGIYLGAKGIEDAREQLRALAESC